MFLAYFQELFLAKYLSGRTMELDKVDEPEHDEQSSAASEMVSVAATMFIARVSAKCCSPGDRDNY